jgi:peptidylprolyl isomerase
MANPLIRMDIGTDDGTGLVLIECYPHLAPRHVEAVLGLANSGQYDGTVFHRVIPNFMAQGGWTRQQLPQLEAEFNSHPHTEGVCSMARTNDPNSASDQFFICFNACPWLDGQYTVWGKVIYGMEHVHGRIQKGEPPEQPTAISRMRQVDPTSLRAP